MHHKTEHNTPRQVKGAYKRMGGGAWFVADVENSVGGIISERFSSEEFAYAWLVGKGATEIHEGCRLI